MAIVYPEMMISVGPSVDSRSNPDSFENCDALSSPTIDSPLVVPPSFAQAARAKMRTLNWDIPAHSTENQNLNLPQLQFPECCFHKSLVDRLEFIEPPAVSDAGLVMITGACYRLFIGQVRFETTAAEMRWLIHYLTGVSALKVELRGMGCCMAYFESYEEIQQVCKLRSRLLFDHTGVWFARDDEQQTLLHRYVAYYVSLIGRGFRLPKDMCVMEEERFQFIPALPQRTQPNFHQRGYPTAAWTKPVGRPPLPPAPSKGTHNPYGLSRQVGQEW